MIYVIDIDGTICTQTNNVNNRNYDKAIPLIERINKVNKLYEEGNQIIYFTSRGSGSGIDWKEFTEKQLMNWKVKYHKLIFGKPSGDIFIDDKSINSIDWF